MHTLEARFRISAAESNLLRRDFNFPHESLWERKKKKNPPLATHRIAFEVVIVHEGRTA